MKEWIKNHRSLVAVFVVVWIAAIVGLFVTGTQYNSRVTAIVDEGTFTQNTFVVRKDDWVGANIWLKQAVHGTKDIKYRYVVKTDCPSWDYETRYMTTKPIEWIDETSAVEVIIYESTVWYEDTAYASGQYFLIPILDNLASETGTVDEWETRLVKQAYQSYVQSVTTDKTAVIICNWFVFVWPAVSFIFMFWFMNHRKNRFTGHIKPEPENEPTNFLEQQ